MSEFYHTNHVNFNIQQEDRRGAPGQARLSRADAAGVYTDSDDDSTVGSTMRRELQVESMRNLVTDGQPTSSANVHAINTIQNASELRDEKECFVAEWVDEQAQRNSSKQDIEMDSIEKRLNFIQSKTFPQKNGINNYKGSGSGRNNSHFSGNENVPKVIYSDSRHATHNRLTHNHINSFPSIGGHTKSTQTDSHWLDDVLNEIGVASMIHDTEEKQLPCLNCHKNDAKRNMAVQYTKVENLARTIEFIMDKRSPQPLLVSHIPELISRIYGCVIDPVQDSDCRVSWNDIVSQYCPSLQIVRLPNQQELVFLIE